MQSEPFDGVLDPRRHGGLLWRWAGQWQAVFGWGRGPQRFKRWSWRRRLSATHSALSQGPKQAAQEGPQVSAGGMVPVSRCLKKDHRKHCSTFNWKKLETFSTHLHLVNSPFYILTFNSPLQCSHCTEGGTENKWPVDYRLCHKFLQKTHWCKRLHPFSFFNFISYLFYLFLLALIVIP